MLLPMPIDRSSSLSPQTLIICGHMTEKIQDIARLSPAELVALNTIIEHVHERLTTLTSTESN